MSKTTINVHSLNHNEKKFKLELDSSLKEQLKQEINICNVLSVDKVYCIFFIRKEATKVHLRGSIKLRITQEDAITSEPIVSDLELPVSRCFIQGIQKNFKRENTKDFSLHDIDLAYEKAEVEQLNNHDINLISIIAEQLILDVDPYIKKH